MPRRFRRLISVLLLGPLLLTVGSCASRRNVEDYVPELDQSRHALEMALEAWRQGRPTGLLTDGPPAVCVVDSHRRPEQVLRSYKILGQTPGEGPRCFAVRLYLENPTEEQKARYLLVGIDPLWVYRHEDYEMMIHWECAGEGPNAPERKPAPSASEKPSHHP
jgi:hypothetical protein